MISSGKKSAQSLTSRVDRAVSFQVLALTAIISCVAISALYLACKRLVDRQTELWLQSFPKSVLLNLIDSDHFAVNAKVKLLESTGLFRGVAVFDNRKNLISQFSHDAKTSAPVRVPIVDEAGAIWGYYEYDVDNSEVLQPFFYSAFTVLLLLGTLTLVVSRKIRKGVAKELDTFTVFLGELEKAVDELATLGSVPGGFLAHVAPHEEQRQLNQAFSKLIGVVQKKQAEIREYTRRAENQKFQQELSKVAMQVAHDIRSPVTALTMMLDNLSELSEEKRVLLRSAVTRVQDIANGLLARTTPEQKAAQEIKTAVDENASEVPSTEMVASLIDGVLSEKRLQFRTRAEVTLESNLDETTYGLFCRLQPIEFKRLLSNLINNAVEAMPTGGKVEVVVFGTSDTVLVKVKDNGRGIPEAVLPSLGQKGFTFGKSGGSGLGLHHAKKTVEKWGGNLNIISNEGFGTVITLGLTRRTPPAWFVPEFRLGAGPVVILDDDVFIHHIWDERFGNEFGILHFHKIAEFEAYLPRAPRGALFLVDYELLGETLNGLELILHHGLEDRAVLVTSQFENVVARCREFSVRVLPKSMARVIPISRETPLIPPIAPRFPINPIDPSASTS